MQEVRATRAPKRFLSPMEQGQFKSDKAQVTEVLKNPLTRRFIEGTVESRNVLERQNIREEKQAAPDLDGKGRDKAAALVKELELKLRDGLLSDEEMRRNPHGAVEINTAWEKRNANNVTRWRNAVRALHKGAQQSEIGHLTNLDRIRPSSSSMSMIDVQIPKTRTMSFPSEAYKQGWESAFGAQQLGEVADGTDYQVPPSKEQEGLDDPDMTDEELEQITAPVLPPVQVPSKKKG